MTADVKRTPRPHYASYNFPGISHTRVNVWKTRRIVTIFTVAELNFVLGRFEKQEMETTGIMEYMDTNSIAGMLFSLSLTWLLL